MKIAHIVDRGAFGFRCIGCGGLFDAPPGADAAKLLRAAHAWADLHQDCAVAIEGEKVGSTWRPGLAQAVPRG